MNEARILYIDDETDLLELAASFFEDEGLAIRTCSTFDEALELIRQNSYELIISDAKMPSGSGLDLLRIIKGEGYAGKVILVTGHLENPDESQDIGLDLIIYKPVDFLNLIDQARDLLSPSTQERWDSDQSP